MLARRAPKIPQRPEHESYGQTYWNDHERVEADGQHCNGFLPISTVPGERLVALAGKGNVLL